MDEWLGDDTLFLIHFDNGQGVVLPNLQGRLVINAIAFFTLFL